MRTLTISTLIGIATLFGCAFDPICGSDRSSECEFVEEPSADMDAGEDSRDLDPGDPLNNPRPACEASSDCAENSRAGAINVGERSFGCVNSDFVQTSTTVVSAVCDASDLWYVARTARCDRNSFILEGHLESEVPACLDRLELSLFDNGGFRICESDIARCERQADGSHVARVIVRQGAPSGSYYFLVESNASFAAPFTFTVRALP